MIRINRIDCPQSLQKPPESIDKDDCNNDDVIQALMNMQYGKCCYCERNLKDLSKTERELDHYIPRSSFRGEDGTFPWHLINAWQNLLYSCRTCNSRKHNKHPFNRETNEREIIDPSDDSIDPEDYIDFIFDYPLFAYKAKDESPLGSSTIKKLRFNERTDLIRRFRKIWVEIEDHFGDMINALEGDEEYKLNQKRNELSRVMSAHDDFSCFKRKFIQTRLAELNEKQIPKLEARHGRSFPRIEVYIPSGYEVVN